MKHVVISVSLLFLCAFSAAPAAATPEMKVGFVDVQKALSETKAGKRAQDQYQSEVKKAQTDIDKKKDAFQTRQEAFEKQRDSLNEDARSNKQEELISLEKDLKRSFQDSQSMLRRRNTQIVGELVTKVRKVVDKVAQQKGFTLIFEKTSDAVLYADNQIDLTDEVVKAFDAEFE